ncbi:dehydration-responsive element-binding protein 1B-like [Henckelia pumila]|uniref:dehydration-responsive element-binding protein 1B-like n=1 Tax=Henckelia pumila TaxID=405737 RepID=UPI003C6E91A0
MKEVLGGRGGCGGIRRRDESRPVFEAGRRNKKSRTLTSRGEKEPPQLNIKLPDFMQSLPQARLALRDAVKNFRPSSHSSPASVTVETLVEETCDVIDFPSMKGIVLEDSSMDFVIGFVDEEEMFNMPGLVNGMAEGMLLTPPAMKRGFNWSHDIHDHQLVDDANFYINLWAD